MIIPSGAGGGVGGGQLLRSTLLYPGGGSGSGTWTRLDETTLIDALIVGAGGGGGSGNAANSLASGGSGGSAIRALFSDALLPDGFDYEVGTGGNGGTGGAAGDNGGYSALYPVSSVDEYLANGGIGGLAGATAGITAGVAGPLPSISGAAPTLQFAGGRSDASLRATPNIISGAGGDSVFGATGGPNEYANGVPIIGNDAIWFGGGGSGGFSTGANAVGGQGYEGCILLLEYGSA